MGDLIDALVAQLESPEPSKRMLAVRKLALMRDNPRARDVLADLLHHDDTRLRRAAWEALNPARNPASVALAPDATAPDRSTLLLVVAFIALAVLCGCIVFVAVMAAYTLL
jgi:hypothetical protein